MLDRPVYLFLRTQLSDKIPEEHFKFLKTYPGSLIVHAHACATPLKQLDAEILNNFNLYQFNQQTMEPDLNQPIILVSKKSSNPTKLTFLVKVYIPN